MGLFSAPYWLVMAMLVVFVAGASCVAHALVRRFVPYRDLADHNDVAGFMIAIVGVLYAVLAAFVVVVVWEQYNTSDTNYGTEVSTVADVHAFARSLQESDARAVQLLVHRYIHEMIDYEWPAMLTGGHSSAATATLADLSRTIARVQPRTDVQIEGRVHLLESAQRLFDLRNRRLSDNVQTLPPVLWAALIVGAIITIGFGFLFGVRNVRIQLLMTGSIAALIGVVFALLIELDFPYQRDTAIGASRWIELERYLDINGDAATFPPARPALGKAASGNVLS